MDTIILGPFVLTSQVLVWAGSALTGFAVLRYRTRAKTYSTRTGSILINALLVWLIAWKLSQFVFDPSLIKQGLPALLYFNGGIGGAWLAAAVTTAYVVYSKIKHAIEADAMFDSLLVFLLAGYTARLWLVSWLGEGNPVTLGLSALLGTVILFRWLIRTGVARFQAAQLIIIFAVGHAAISTLAYHLWEKAETIALPSTVGLGIGQLAPDFELTDMNGRPVKLSELRGKTVVLNFWATWCPPCRTEMPEMQKFYETNRDRDITILAVNAGHTESSSNAVEKRLQHKGITIPVVFDSTGQVTKTYRVNAFPSTFIIEQDGLVRAKYQGPLNQLMLSDAVH